jgi:hypothetical protein
MARTQFLAAAALLLSVSTVWAADLSIRPTRPSAGQGIPATCQEWTDGCRVCARQADGSSACSNVGIACVPQTARCTRP